MAQLGSKGRPFSFDVYTLMCNSVGGSVWTGGWVRLKSNSEVIYITLRQGFERDNDDGVIGSAENPFSHEAYNEMNLKKIWPGGFVRIAYGVDPEYIDGNDGEESACGCGSGCGCGGRFLMAGQEWITDMSINVIGVSTVPELLICWGEGSFDTPNLPYVSAGMTFNGGASNQITPLRTSWGDPFIVRIEDDRLTSIFTYNIPSLYRK